MKALSTLKKFFSRKEGWLSLLILAVFMVFGCYEFKSINQPTEANSNSSFDVAIVMHQDPDDENNFVDEGSPMANHGLLGILLPEGWTVKDSIVYFVVSADSMMDGDGVWHVASQDYSSSGHLVYNEDHANALTESASAPPPGYYWWGARTDTTVDMHFYDSLYYTVTIMTDDQLGQFALRYAVGDEDSDNRMPYDVDVISDPMPITITEAVSVGPSILESENIELYPNPSHGLLNVKIRDLNSQKVDLMIYDLQGRIILTKILDSQENLLDLKGYDPGTYVLRMTAGEDVMTRKFILY
jgi:hypothetical protein